MEKNRVRVWDDQMKSITYHGGYFTTSDALLLKPPGWLNDSCILHLFLRMKHEILGDSPSVLLMGPSVISFLRLQCDTEEEMKELAEGLALRERNALLVPVNDMESFSGSSTHWSLLCGIRRNRLNEKRIRNSPEWYVHVTHIQFMQQCISARPLNAHALDCFSGTSSTLILILEPMTVMRSPWRLSFTHWMMI